MRRTILSIARGIDKAVLSAARALDALAQLTMVVASLMVLLHIFMRYVVNKPLGFTEEVGGAFTLIITFAAMGLLFARKEHLRVSVITDRLRPSVRRILELVITASGLFFVSAWAWYFIKLTADVYTLNIKYQTLTKFPVWPVYAIITFGIIIMDIIVLAYLVKQMASLVNIDRALNKGANSGD